MRRSPVDSTKVLLSAGSLGKRSFVQPEYRPLTPGAIFATIPYEKQRYSPDLMDQETRKAFDGFPEGAQNAIMRALHAIEQRRYLLKDLRPLIERDIYVGLPYLELIGFQDLPAQSRKNVLSLKLSNPASIRQLFLQS